MIGWGAFGYFLLAVGFMSSEGGPFEDEQSKARCAGIFLVLAMLLGVSAAVGQ